MIIPIFAMSQEINTRSLQELINTEDPGWNLVEEWMKDAKNKIEIIERDPLKADSALYQTQVTTRSPMGAIVHGTGGILIDDGWIRILGSGSEKLNRSLPEWNKGKSFQEYEEAPNFLLIADDAIGGFFAINGGLFDQETLGNIYYFAPDRLEWENLDITYSDFIYWAFTGNLEAFYEDLRWKGWRAEIMEMGANKTMNFYPFLWTKYDSIEELNRRAIPIEEIWFLQMDIRKQLLEQTDKK